MAKRDKIPPPDAQSLRSAVKRFTKQVDRGTALVAAAWLDDLLEACLRAHFRPDKAIADHLFRSDGPLSSFSARIKVAYLLDLIGPSAFHDLEQIRKIRNDFAHERNELRFTTPSIKTRCGQLVAVAACRDGGWDMRSAKEKFVITSYFLGESLLSGTKPRRRNAMLDHMDVYFAWIRRMVKSSKLAQAVEELDKGFAEEKTQSRAKKHRRE